MRRIAFALGLAVATLTALLVGASMGAPASSTCRWSLVASLGVQRDGLFAASAGSASSVWVVGTHWIYPNYNPSFTAPVIEYWDGRHLAAVRSPGAASVAAMGREAWTVGWNVGALTKRKGAPILHWRGRRWSASANPGGPGSSLNGVAMISPRDVWAIGSTKALIPLVLHWNGSSWSKVTAPAGLGTEGTLISVARIPGTAQVWVDGIDANASGFAARWTGSGWETYSLRYVGGRSGNLAAASSSNAWIVGEKGDNTGKITRDVIYHWDGSTWSEVPTPNPSATRNSLSGVAARTESDAWAVGNFTRGKKVHALALHWDGSKWSQVKAPGLSLTAVTTVPGTRQAWAVAATGEIERYRC